MKNLMKFLGIIVLAAVFGFSMTACESTKSSVSAEPSVVETYVLVITGLDDYNGSYIYASGFEVDPTGETYVLAAVDISEIMGESLPTGVLISGGIAVLPLWIISNDFDEETGEVVTNKVVYTDDINSSFGIIIWEGGEVLNRYSEPLYGDIYVTTVDGVRSGALSSAEHRER